MAIPAWAPGITCGRTIRWIGVAQILAAPRSGTRTTNGGGVLQVKCQLGRDLLWKDIAGGGWTWLDMGWLWLDIWLAFYLEQRSDFAFGSCVPQVCRSGSKHVPSRASSRQGSRQQSKESVEDVTVLPSGVWSATIQEGTGKKQKHRIEERFWMRDFAGDGGDVYNFLEPGDQNLEWPRANSFATKLREDW